MILPDANVLLYAVNTGERPARGVAARVAGSLRKSKRRRPRLGRAARLRAAQHPPRIFERPLSPEDAIRVVQGWLAQPRARVAHPGERHAETLGRLLRAAGSAGNLTTDAHLAALAIEHGAVILTFDRDFARFDGVRWTAPGAACARAGRPGAAIWIRPGFSRGCGGLRKERGFTIWMSFGSLVTNV